MQSKRIKYFSYRGCSEPQRRRDNSPAADTKIDYIIESDEESSNISSNT